jgi:hypothetical protein
MLPKLRARNSGSSITYINHNDAQLCVRLQHCSFFENCGVWFKWNQSPTTKLRLLLWRLCFRASALTKRFVAVNVRSWSKLKCYCHRTEADEQLYRLRCQFVGHQILEKVRVSMKKNTDVLIPCFFSSIRGSSNKHRKENNLWTDTLVLEPGLLVINWHLLPFKQLSQLAHPHWVSHYLSWFKNSSNESISWVT